MLHQRRIFIEKLKIDARIGVLEHELRQTQPIYIDARIDVQTSQAVDDQNIDTVLDYRLIREAIIAQCTAQHIHLVETMADQINQRLLREFPDIQRVQLKISKPLAFSDCDAVGIELDSTR